MVNLSKIRLIAKEKGIALTEVAKKAEMSPQGLSRVIRTGVTSVQSLDLIANALGVSPLVFFEGYNDRKEPTLFSEEKREQPKKADNVRLVNNERALMELLQKQNDVLLSTNALLRKYIGEK